MHGVDWPGLGELYKALVPFVSHRTDLTYVISEMVSELGAGHCYVGGGDQPELKSPQTGLLGCTFVDSDEGYYRIDKIYAGENWHDDLRSPLTEPGVNVKSGDYLIAIDGNEVKTGQNVFSYLANKSDRIVEITVNDKPTKDGARTCKVKPISGETNLIYYNWVKKNRDYVTDKTDGQVGYIHIPDMSNQGLKEFIKWYYAQMDKKALIVDIRYNGGGFVSQLILRRLLREMAGMFSSRDGGPQTYPAQTFVGPKVCITNQYAASDGDIFGYFFKHYKLGTVIGMRSWGGVIGISGMPPLLDGGYAFVPGGGTYSLEGKWIIENIGVEPDIVVDNLPKRVIEGYDDQLDKAIEIALDEMKTYSPWKEPNPKDFPKP
jgi:tricorn protease